MASKVQKKQRARERRLAAERAEEARRARARRVQMFGGAILVALIAVAMAIAVSYGGASSPPRGGAAKKIAAQVDHLLAGIPQHGTEMGNPKARITLTFFGDLQCPICAAFATGASEQGVTGGLPQFVRDQVRTGQAKIVYRSSTARGERQV